MSQRGNRSYLGDDSRELNYNVCISQEFASRNKFEIIICSLVLVHNSNDFACARITAKMKELSNTIFLFEPVDSTTVSSYNSAARETEELINMFSENKVERKQNYLLFTDKMILLKLVRY